MAKRKYIYCNSCKQLVLVAGEPQQGDLRCPHKFSRIPITPTIFYENRQGKRLYPWTSDDLPSEYTRLGYQRREISGLGDIRRFERETSRQMQHEHGQQEELEQRVLEQERRARHDSLRNDLQMMDEFHRNIAREAMEQEDAGYSENYSPDFYIEAYN